MEYSPLFLAHQHDRKADRYILCKRFDEAVSCHKQASDQLAKAIKLTTVTQALEALQLQLEYHRKQENIIQLKKFQFEVQKKIVEYKKCKMSMQKKSPQKGSKGDDLQWAIFRTMEEADSLLGMLLPKDPSEAELMTAPGNKRPKDDCTVIEELHTLNTQLKLFISQLLAQLEASEKQVEALKSRLCAYEQDSRPIPELAPLEIPQYDFTSPSTNIFPQDLSQNNI